MHDPRHPELANCREQSRRPRNRPGRHRVSNRDPAHAQCHAAWQAVPREKIVVIADTAVAATRDERGSVDRCWQAACARSLDKTLGHPLRLSVAQMQPSRIRRGRTLVPGNRIRVEYPAATLDTK